jgi:hypothetical protein
MAWVPASFKISFAIHIWQQGIFDKAVKRLHKEEDDKQAALEYVKT